MAEPTQPSDPRVQNIRYKHPTDSTKVIQIDLINTGNTAGDGTEIWALAVGGAGGPLPTLPSSIPVNPPVAVTGTAAQMHADQALVNSIMIRAPGGVGGNAGSVWIGGDATVAAGNGYELTPGSWVSIPIDNLNKIWIIGTPGDELQWIGG